tara:strand:+ start:49033 stop:49578 length:546 start_codon:yes stop_codon:yes gene_type:complete
MEDFMKRLFTIAAAVAVLFAANSSYAFKADGFYIALGLSPSSSSIEVDPAAAVETEQTYTNLKLGWGMPSGLYLGVALGISSGDLITGHTGVTFGYMASNGFQILGTYFLTPKFELDSSGTEFDEGSGIGVELNQVFDITGSFGAGFGIVYETFETTQADGVDQDVSWQYMYPQIVLAGSF